jgi:hypothetical protein
MASGVRRLCLDATLGRYWRIGLVVRIVWIGWMDLRFGGIFVSQKPAKRTPRRWFVAVPAERVPAPSCNRDRAPDVGVAPMTFSRHPCSLRSTLHRPVLARSHSLKVLSSFLLSSRAC